MGKRAHEAGGQIFTIDVFRDQLPLASIPSLPKKPHIRPALAYPPINDPYSSPREPILEIKRRRPEGNAYLHSIVGRIALKPRLCSRHLLRLENPCCNACFTILALDILMNMPAGQNRSNCAFRNGFLRLATMPTAQSGLKCGDSIFSRRKIIKTSGSVYSSALNSSKVRPAWRMIARKVPFAISLFWAQ